MYLSLPDVIMVVMVDQQVCLGKPALFNETCHGTVY